MRVIIAGGRDFINRRKFAYAMEDISKDIKITEVVCGMCRGADMMGRGWAMAHDIPVKEMPADWNEYGKRAGYVRNAEMAQYGDALIAFWDGLSLGTKNMMEVALKKGLYVKRVGYHSGEKDGGGENS